MYVCMFVYNIFIYPIKNNMGHRRGCHLRHLDSIFAQWLLQLIIYGGTISHQCKPQYWENLGISDPLVNQHSSGKSPFFSVKNQGFLGPSSIAMLNYQRVTDCLSQRAERRELEHGPLQNLDAKASFRRWKHVVFKMFYAVESPLEGTHLMWLMVGCWICTG